MKEIRFILPDQTVDAITELLAKAGITIMESTETNWHRQVLLDRIEAEIQSNLMASNEQLGLIMVAAK